jgi:hypothetical protein
MAHQDARFIPVRKKFDQLSIIKDYAVHPRLDYRYVISTSLTALGKNICTKVLEACLSSRQILSGVLMKNNAICIANQNILIYASQVKLQMHTAHL